MSKNIDISKKIKPLRDRVLIKEDINSKEKKTAYGIIIPITVDTDKGGKSGEVKAIGEGHYEDGKLVPIPVKIGDNVLFQWGDKIQIEGEEYYIVKASELLAVIK
jgi:chaperonin GroES